MPLQCCPEPPKQEQAWRYRCLVSVTIELISGRNGSRVAKTCKDETCEHLHQEAEPCPHHALYIAAWLECSGFEPSKCYHIGCWVGHRHSGMSAPG